LVSIYFKNYVSYYTCIYSHLISLVDWTVGINISTLIDWFNPLVHWAEDYVYKAWCQINPEKIFKCFSRAKVQKWVLLNSSWEIIGIAEASVYDSHVGNKFPIIFLENAVSADGIYKASGSWYRMN